ncbi:MBL fold metallo-hydrolase [Barnesiella viscericola]|uniref:MBL fold metallo-hydrolase n=1 Tax=Barnesiella viscericola TaxID=397865 RepID=UPI0025A38ACA|nr:MBL fold metallo-hydrolase [Barnesiella viscericola]MDM8267688.1 MBL fold metallo-hydrolase [Barnesiella viscericola]
MMRKSIFLLSSMLVASLCGAGCSSSQKQASATDETEAVFACTDSVTTECDGVKLTQIRDNAQERLMQLSLFGELPQTLIDSLNIGQGVPASVSVFLLEIDGKRILFDTGMGSADSRLLTNLSAAGVTPADIDYLYLTHFHGDHIGGMMKGDTVVFPKAEVYASRQEYDAWMQMPDEKKMQVAATMEAYKDRLHLVAHGDTLPCGVVALDCAGHTPGHTAYRAGRFLIVGDLVHGAALQMAHPEICAAYDMDPQSAIKQRRYYLDYARQNHLLLAGMHQPAGHAK